VIIAGAIWAATSPGGLIGIAFVAAVLFLAYKRLSLLSFTITFTVLLLAYRQFGAPYGVWMGLLYVLLGLLWLFNLPLLRKALITRPFLKTYRRMLPSRRSARRLRPAPSGGTASCSPATPTGRSCCRRKRQR
jgi:hypothetical protein